LKVDTAAGTYETIKDFGVAGSVPYRLSFDVDELAGTTYQGEVYTRETDTDAWWDIGGSGSIAANSDSTFTIDRYRYVKVSGTFSGGDFAAGVIGYAI
jgi:hypothetical protein